MHILGLSAYYHDSAACLVRDGDIVAAAQEERFTRKKHDASFPKHAVDYCLAEAGIDHDAIDMVAFYDKPFLKFERILETYLAYWPAGFRLFRLGLPAWLTGKLRMPRALDRGLEGRFGGRYVFLEHHESHAASAFFPSPFEEAAIVTLDGVGEWATGSIARGTGNRIELLEELHFPHSLGLLYSAFTYLCGFRVNSGEYKLMGLAPYGRPRFRDAILEELIDLREDGSFRLNMRYFAFGHRDRMTAPRLEELFGGPPRAPESPITRREVDLAASIQSVTEEIVVRVARHAHALTGSENLVMAGGVALNCVANGRVERDGPFERLWVQPAAGDAGGAVGAALFVWFQLLDEARRPGPLDSMKGALLGPAYTDEEIREVLDARGVRYEEHDPATALPDRVAQLLDEQRVVGHFSGRMEFGPRALGSRSILADARSKDMWTTLNAKIKFREEFRPFAPAVLGERAHELFEGDDSRLSPYMLTVAPVREDIRRATDGGSDRGLERVSEARSAIPAVTHMDYSARVQTVHEDRHPRLHAILKSFARRTDCPVLVNTSFNVRGEPIVNTPEQALVCFLATEMDALVLERFVVLKADQRDLGDVDARSHLSRFSPD